jgi:hypothetical protein
MIAALVCLVLALSAFPAAAAEWSRAYIRRLPDSAFAVVETAHDGRKVRHLPHHDESGAVDLGHLRAARSRLGQVRWADPASEEVARQHLEGHRRELEHRPHDDAPAELRHSAPARGPGAEPRPPVGDQFLTDRP